jgi:hypothetical protein
MQPTNLLAASRPHHLDPSKKTCRVVFVTRNFGDKVGTSNVGVGVTNCQIAKVLRRDGYWADCLTVDSGTALNQYIQQTQAEAIATGCLPISNVIIASPSWMTTTEIRGLCGKYTTITFALVNHSGPSYLTIDINDEGSGIWANRLAVNLQRDSHNFELCANNPRFVELIQKKDAAPCRLLNNLYDCEDFATYTAKREIGSVVRIASFGAPRHHKNQLSAAMAALIIARQLGAKLELYINSAMENDERLTTSRNDLFREERDASIISVPWEAWPDFKRTMSRMHLSIQASFDETMNMSVCDAISVGVPSVVGPCVEWMPPSAMCVPHDPCDVAKVGLALLHDTHAVEDGRKALRAYVAAALERWREFLGR